MNKINGFLLASAGAVILLPSASAASAPIWTGGAGNNKLDDSANWQDGQIGVIVKDYLVEGVLTENKTAELQGREVYVSTGKKETWDLSEASFATHSKLGLGELIVKGNTNLTIRVGANKPVGFSYYENLDIENGSVLNWVCESAWGSGEASSWIINGIMNINGTGASTGFAEYVQIGSNGIVNYVAAPGGAPMGTWNDTITHVTLDLDLSLANSPLEMVTRVLASHFTASHENLWSFYAEDKTSLASLKVGTRGELDSLGEYYFYQDDEGIKVDYMKVKSVPEPSTATLGILALTSLLLRRKRY